jgi:regulator of sigma E protease
MSFLFTLGVLLVVLGVLVFVHEAGHFIAAKWAGVYVHRFSLGLGSPIPWLTWTRGETEYSISWLPLGGYVKMATAEEGADSSALEGGAAHPEHPVPPDRMFEAKPLWKRMLVILAGVTMNALFAWALYTFLVAKNGEVVDPTTTVGRVLPDSLPSSAQPLLSLRPGDRIVAINGLPMTTWNQIEETLTSASADEIVVEVGGGRRIVLPIHHTALDDRVRAVLALQPFRAPVVDSVAQDLPAGKAGIQPRDTILAVNGDTVLQWYDLVDRIRASAGVELRLRIGRKGTRVETSVTPVAQEEPVPGGGTRTVGKIGVAPYIEVTHSSLSFGRAVVAGGRQTLTASTQIVRTVQGILSGRISRKTVGGPIAIGQLAAQSARLGLDTFLAFMAFISVNLAVLNLLPIPVLDGGQFLFLFAEGVLRRPLSLKLRERLTVLGLVLIVLLMVLAFSNDIPRLFHRS